MKNFITKLKEIKNKIVNKFFSSENWKRKWKSILKRYYNVHRNVASIDLVFDSFTELIQTNFGNGEVEKLNGVLFNKIEEAFSIIPRKYKININIYLKNFNNYKEERVKEIINENLELKLFSLKYENHKNLLKTFGLLFFGVMFLTISYILNKKFSLLIFTDIANISGTLLIWEAISGVFFKNSENAQKAYRINSKIKSINIKHAKE